MNRRWHLAQANVSRLRLPPDAPANAGLLAAVREVNRLAERSSGFVWRHPSDEHLTTAGSDDPLLVVNLSVWESYAPLHDFVYRSAHARLVRNRSRWFDRVQQPSTVLWWVAEGAFPTVTDAFKRLAWLRRIGPSPQAFTVKARFDPVGRREPARGGHGRTSRSA